MNWTRTTAPVLNALSLAELRAQCRIPEDMHDDDGRVQAMGSAAAAAYEQYAHRGLLTQTITARLSDWFLIASLPHAAPLQSVTSVKYRAADGTLTTLASTNYLVDTTSEPGRIVRAPNVAWPALQSDRLDSRVEVVYVVGFTAASEIPADVKHGLLLLVDSWYWGRVPEGEIPGGVRALWAPYRVWSQPMVAA